MRKHLQQCFAIYSKPLDKNGQLRGARKGERRKGVGRPKRGERASERHRKRGDFAAREPIHVIVRATRDVQPLRRTALYKAIRRATEVVARRNDMRIVELSIQNTHIHLMCEARDRTSLAKGMQSFGVSAARNINTALLREAIARGERDATARRGPVIADRYHACVLKTPRQVRNCLAYILNNWRHHRVDRNHAWPCDPYSSGPVFTGWRELGGKALALPSLYRPLVVTPASTWLLRVGWKLRNGNVSLYEVPGDNDGLEPRSRPLKGTVVGAGRS
ncbi:MAG: transposase [Kofleriaceae bacterium]